MKSLSFLSIITLSFTFSTGQAQEKTLGPMIKMTMKEAWADLEPLASDQKGTYYLLVPYAEVISGPVLGGGSEYSIGRVNNQMEMEITKPLSFEFQGKALEYEFVFEMGEKVLFFTSFQNQDQKKTYLFVQSLNLEKLELNDDLKKIGEIDFSGHNKYKTADFDYEISPDSSKLLITYSLLDDDNYMLSFGYDVYLSTFEQVSSWNGTLDMSDGIYMFDQFRITNKGDVYLLTRYFTNEKALDKSADFKKNGLLSSSRSLEFRANYETRIVKLGSDHQSKIIQVSIPSQFLVTAELGVSDDHLIIIGFYSAPESALPEGAVFQKLDGSGNVIKVSTKDFGDLFAQPSDISNKSNGLLTDSDQYENYRFVIKDIHYKNDGGYVLSAERTVNQVKTQNSAGQVTTYSVDHTDDIAVIDVSKNGDIKGVHKIEKNQETTGLGYLHSSYYFCEAGDKLHFIMSNIGKSNTTLMGKWKDTRAELVTIDQSGNQTRKELFNSNDDRITIRSRDTFKDKRGSLVLYGHENNRYARFVRIDL